MKTPFICGKNRITKRDVSVEHPIGGPLVCATVINGERVFVRYIGWQKRKAVADFVREVNKGQA